MWVYARSCVSVSVYVSVSVCVCVCVFVLCVSCGGEEGGGGYVRLRVCVRMHVCMRVCVCICRGTGLHVCVVLCCVHWKKERARAEFDSLRHRRDEGGGGKGRERGCLV